MAAQATTLHELNAVISQKNAPVIAYFRASWAPMCTQTDAILNQLVKDCPNVVFISIEAEESEEIVDKYEVASVPAFVSIEGGKKTGIIVGANAPEISKMAVQLDKKTNGSSAAPVTTRSLDEGATTAPLPLNQRLEKLVSREPVMLFMKGSPGAERCGFSRQIVSILEQQGVKYGHFDILEDEEVRQGLKEYSKWPTYPQLYSKGKLVGGLDIVKELVEENELKEALGAGSSDLSSRLEKLVSREPVMLFMKGSPGAERCGFSRQIVSILEQQGVKYGHFDILEDEEVRQGLKEYSKWPTYPQLYSKGKLVGGLDIVKELVESGEFKSELGL